MFFATSRLSLLAILMLASAGCLQSQLRKNTIVQMQTVHDIQQQQVLDNLAMFVHDINSYPYFSLVAGGTTELTETGSLAVTNGWSRGVGGFLYNSLGINPTVSCTSQGNWQVNPINDSIKLTVMRCVYQKAVSGCCGRQLPANCPDCNAMLKYYVTVPRTALPQLWLGDLRQVIGTSRGVLRGGQRSIGWAAAS